MKNVIFLLLFLTLAITTPAAVIPNITRVTLSNEFGLTFNFNENLTNWIILAQAVNGNTNIPGTDYQKKVFTSGDNGNQTILYLTNTIFTGTYQTPAKLLKFNASDLSTYSSVTFANDGFHGVIQDML